jgi:anti-anti-sigma factor
MEITELKAGTVSVLKLNGRLDANTSNPAQEKFAALLEHGEKNFAVDLSSLDYISSAGLRVFMMVSKRLKNCGGKIVVCCAQDPIKELFEIAGFSDLFLMCSTVDEAMRQFI